MPTGQKNSEFKGREISLCSYLNKTKNMKRKKEVVIKGDPENG